MEVIIKKCKLCKAEAEEPVLVIGICVRCQDDVLAARIKDYSTMRGQLRDAEDSAFKMLKLERDSAKRNLKELTDGLQKLLKPNY